MAEYLDWTECKPMVHSVNTLVSIYFQSGPEVIKLFSCSTQLRLEFFLLINIKTPTFMSRINYNLLSFEPEFSTNFDYFNIYHVYEQYVS